MDIIPKEDVIEFSNRNLRKFIRNKEANEAKETNEVRIVRKEQYSYYREVLKNHTDKWKTKIRESGVGKIEISMRYIRDNILEGSFKNRSDIVLYSRIKDILLERGIKIKLYHHYGARLIMMIADESEIISELELHRMQRLNTAKRAGFDKYYDYHRNTESMKKIRRGYGNYDKNITCPKYLGNYMADKIMNSLFSDGMKNPIYIGCIGSGLWDWKTKEGMLIKCVSSSILCNMKKDPKVYGKRYSWIGWQWNISGNKVTDYFLLIGYGQDREELDVLNMWFIHKDDMIRGRPFWDRMTFSIRYDKDNQLKEMEKYLVNEDNLEKVRKIFNSDNIDTIKIDDNEVQDDKYDDIRNEISDWYKVSFRS